jgi:hypothetical protein
MVLGLVAAVATLSFKSPPWQVMVAALIIAWAAWLDSGATNITRPEQLYFSQALLGFGTTLFVGPALAFGFLRILRTGPQVVVSVIVLYSVTQNIGALAGAALLGSYQIASTHAHAAALSEHLLGTDPQVVARLQAQGPAALWQAATREANVLAFNDVYIVVAALAAATALFIACALAINALRRTPK